MNKLSTEKRVAIVACLVEGNSVRATCRLTGAAKGTVLGLLVDMGCTVSRLHHLMVRNVPSKRLQLDELWTFCGSKDKNVPAGMEGNENYGSVWTWTAIDADSKLCLSWLVGRRDAECANSFLRDIAFRVKGRPQVTSDGLGLYPGAVEAAFAGNVDYAQLIKVYGAPRETEARYSPAECVGTERKVVVGTPVAKDISTSYVERCNWSVRTFSRRFTRLSNGFSRKLENLGHAVALHFAHFNLCRIHRTLRMTPAMAAGVTDHIWEISELVALMDLPVSK